MNDKNKIWKAQIGKGPLAAAAIHDGHTVRREIEELFALNDADRLREEDPFTGNWTNIGHSSIVGLRSRFEVDLNRPREKAVYVVPEDAWGLKVWKSDLPAEYKAQSLAEYDAFYSEMKKIFSLLEKQFGKFIVFDLHSYNYRRNGPNAAPEADEKNPEVNIGTGTMDRTLWAPVVDRFIKDLRAYNFQSRNLDVRENVKFKGGQFSHWIHQNFPKSGCSLAIEFRKFFMDEWAGKPDQTQLDEIKSALKSTIPGVMEELKKLGAKW